MMKGPGVSDLEKAKKYCVRLLAICSRTEREIVSRLKKAGYPDSVVSGLIDMLKRDKLIDDLAFAGEWIDSRLKQSPRAPRAIRTELEAKGVPEEIVDKAFAEKAVILDEKTIALGLIKEKTRSMSREKLFRFLLQKGFDAEFAEDLINDAVK